MEFIVDFQGFNKPQDHYIHQDIKEFVVKELAVILVEEDSVPTVYQFAPPETWDSLQVRYRSENYWFYRNYLGMAWNDGIIP